MGILAVHITTAKIRESPVIEVALGHLGHPGQIGVGWVPQNDVTMEAVRADDYFPTSPVFGRLRVRARCAMGNGAIKATADIAEERVVQ